MFVGNTWRCDLMSEYLRPTTLDQALLARANGAITPLAGGTDLFAAYASQPFAHDVLDLSTLPGWCDLVHSPAHVEFGAGVTWTQLLNAKLPPGFNGLKAAAREVGGVQIQNRGTLVGNICNASPAADGVPALLSLDASIVWNDAMGAHETPLAEFIVGSRKTLLPPTGLVTKIRVPNPSPSECGAFAKTGARTYLLISTVMASAVVDHRDGKVTRARIAVGAASPVARRVPALEHALIGRACDRSLGDLVTAQRLSVLSPIDDVRADQGYRIDAAVTLLRRVLNTIGSECM